MGIKRGKAPERGRKMTRYTEKRATNKGHLFYQLAVEFYLAHPSDFYQLAVGFYLAHPSEPHPSEASRLLWHMYKWVTAGHYEEPELLDRIDSADDYLKAFFARELESAYNWTHGGKEHFEAACKEMNEYISMDENGEEYLSRPSEAK